MRDDINGGYPLLILGVLLGVVACDHETQTTKRTPLPTLSRSVFTIQPPINGKNISIPNNALVMRGGIPGVFVLNNQGLARFRMVKPGKQVDGYLVIVSGLHRDDQLVLGELSAIRDGSPVTVK